MIDNRMKAVRAKPKAIWYAWFPGDYASKTATLTLVEHGAYRVLLDHYYEMHGSMVANATLLLRVCRAFDPTEVAAVHAVLARYFVERDGYYHHERADAELAKRALLREKRAAAGSKGGKQKVANATNLLASGKDVCHPQQQLQHSKEGELEPTLSSSSPTHNSEAIASEPSGSPAKVIELVPPPPAPTQSPLDLQKELWSRGVAYLKANGSSDYSARTMIGKWRKQCGSDFEVLQLLAKAESEAVSAPVPFIEGTLNAKRKAHGKNNSGQPRTIDDNPRGNFAAIAERLRAERLDREGRGMFDA